MDMKYNEEIEIAKVDKVKLYFEREKTFIVLVLLLLLSLIIVIKQPNCLALEFLPNSLKLMFAKYGKVLFSIAVGYIISFIFYYIQIRMPNNEKRKKAYRYFKQDIIGCMKIYQVILEIVEYMSLGENKYHRKKSYIYLKGLEKTDNMVPLSEIKIDLYINEKISSLEKYMEKFNSNSMLVYVDLKFIESVQTVQDSLHTILIILKGIAELEDVAVNIGMNKYINSFQRASKILIYLLKIDRTKIMKWNLQNSLEEEVFKSLDIYKSQKKMFCGDKEKSEIRINIDSSSFSNSVVKS